MHGISEMAKDAFPLSKGASFVIFFFFFPVASYARPIDERWTKQYVKWLFVRHGDKPQTVDLYYKKNGVFVREEIDR